MRENVLVNVNAIRRLAQRYPKAVREETAAVMRIVVARLEAEVVRRTPRGVGAEGGLAGSIFGEVIPHGDMVRGTVGTPMPYGEVVELGRRPGSHPPVAPLELWARRKLGVPDDEAKSAAYAIARKIFVKGTKGQRMFDRAWKANERWVMDQLQTIAPRVVRRLETNA